MHAHVFLYLLNKMGEKIKCEALLSILMGSPFQFNRFNKTEAQKQDSITICH